ncbi:K02A2.6-like [Cordylochernes scorpioides]|uniref:RNA-directed DNA polymerase n=1 Tax=Cordylochernes scorpioides TaxID=51811 RepID=A0ABY6L5H2_9ARAC|nr:K02A2.6-like [Cordylochernes scorpioides]
MAKLDFALILKRVLNPYLEDVKYPIPNIDSVLSNFQGKKLFTKLDLSKAYHQIEMDDISKKYLVVSTHKGLYKYNRLAFGIKTASEIFQKTMESFFSGINDVYIYFDDILIASEDLESHLDILKRTLNILKENNFTINKNKCLFVKNEIEYLGHKINEFGIYPLKDKLACIKNCPVPKNITELKSFLGFLSFYSKFLPNLSDLAHPLYNLLKKNVKWSWNAGTDRSFNSCKNALDETTCLSHYSLNLPLILSCDASQVGIGATLSHLKDGEERPVCFISRTLNVHERKYSQVEREGLAIVFAVNKFKNYLFGRKFTIYTDHKPLITIFGDKTNLPPLIANRLHRWALTLSNYSFEIKYKKGKDNIIPDFLSRFPECQEDNLEYNDGSGEILLLNTSIIDHVLVAHEIQLDRTLIKLYKIIETGELPSSPNDDLIPYLKRIDDFTILQECIFLENRMVIPKNLHERVLQILHESHAGTNKMKMMARSSIWWPGMDSSIEIITKNCRTCLSNESLPPQRTESWPKYAGPWRRVHMDYFNFKNKLFLLAVDSFSSWFEVSEVPSTSAYFCINFMRNCIARYGFPQVVVSDNGPPFFSSDFGDFLSKNGISHVTSPPYHPQSNGQAEVSVREVKKLLKKQLYENEQVELNLALSRALFFIRTDVNIRKGTSPAELFLGRKIRSRLSVLSKEEVKASKFNSQYVNSKFKVDETVKFRWITNGHPSWYTGKIIKILGRNVYLIKQGDSIKKVHQNYIRKMLPGKSHPTNMNDAERVPTPISEEKSITTPSPDLAPSDYFLFGLLKKELKGKRFDSDEDVQKVVQDFFHTFPKRAYKEGIYKLPERWRRCIESQEVPRYHRLPRPKSRQDCGRQGTSKQVDHCLYRKMEQEREEDSKEHMESDPDYESGKNTTFPKIENTLGRTQEVAPSQEDASPPPVASDVLGSLASTLHQLYAATGLSRDVELSRYDGSYKAQSFFDNYDAQADRAQLQYTERLRRLPNLLQGKALHYFRSLKLDKLYYVDARQALIDLFPETTNASFARFLAIKLSDRSSIEKYYKKKYESLTDGLPVADQRIVAAVQPNTLQELYSEVSRVRGTYSASKVCQQTTRTTPKPSFAPSPRYSTQPPWSARPNYAANPPPSSCRYCGAMHWHAQCPKRPAQSRPRPVYRATTYPQHEKIVLSSPAPFRVTNTRAHVNRSPDPLYTTSPAQAVNSNCPRDPPTTIPDQACPDPQDSTTDGLPCRLYCDASTQGIAGILKQVHPDGKFHPTQYYSRTLRPHERNYNISELECLAIVESIEKFRIYLSSTKFTVYSDHQALQ